jgi:nucleotide-binding universal stress UspA family protein
MYETIVVPHDGSDCASGAVGVAVQFADLFDADISLLAVLEPYMLSLRESPPADPDPGDLDDDWRRTLSRTRSHAQAADVPCSTTVVVGDPREAIPVHADDVDADLVAIGTHGRSGIERLILGSVTERLLRTADLPLLTVSEIKGTHKVDDILVPTDGSSGSDRALTHACSLARRYDATVHGLAVVNTQALAAVGEAGGAIPEVIRVQRENRERDLETVRQRAAAHDLEYTTTVVEGTPDQVINTYADTNDIDVISMGTHGRSGIDRFLRGSVTERTIRASSVPVLTMPLED